VGAGGCASAEGGGCAEGVAATGGMEVTDGEEVVAAGVTSSEVTEVEAGPPETSGGGWCSCGGGDRAMGCSPPAGREGLLSVLLLRWPLLSSAVTW
jgi:hypothetical protein